MNIEEDLLTRKFLLGSIFIFILIIYLRYGFVIHFPNDMVFFYVSILENTGEWSSPADIISLLGYNEKTIFFNLLAPLVDAVGLYTTALITDFLSKLIYLALVVKLALMMGLRENYGLIILLALASCVDLKISTAGIFLWDVGMAHRSFSLLCILGSILLISNGRFLFAGILVGTAISLHAFTALGGFPVLVAMLLVKWQQLNLLNTARLVLTAILPIVLMVTFKDSSASLLTLFTEVSIEQKRLMIERQSYLFLSDWSFFEWLNLVTTAALIPLTATLYSRHLTNEIWIKILIISWAVSVIMLAVGQLSIYLLDYKLFFLIKPGIEFRFVFIISMILLVIGFVNKEQYKIRDVFVVGIFFSWFLFRKPTLIGIFSAAALLSYISPNYWRHLIKYPSQGRVNSD